MSSAEKTAARVSIGKKSLGARIVRDKYLLMLLIPGMVFLVLFKYLPFRYITLAFMDYDLVGGFKTSTWVGLEHFRSFVTGPYFVRLMRNTIGINLYDLVAGFPIPIIFALLLNELAGVGFKKVVQTVTYLPHFISTVVVAGMVVNFLSPSTGIVNIVLNRLFGMEPIYFLAKPEYFKTIYVFMGIWKGFGWSSIVYLAALAGIDRSLYEAAYADGAKRRHMMWHISLPGISSVIVILLILRMGHLLDVGFEAIFLLYNPLVYETADVISTFVYRRGIAGTGEGGAPTMPDYGYATAVGLFKSVISFGLVVVANKLSKTYTESSLF